MIRVHQLGVHAGAFSLQNLSFEVPTGQYGVLMGKTGCGKTTILEAVCGLKRVSSGTVELAGRDVTRARPGERSLGLVPQDCALFTTMTVYDHLAFGPTVQKWPRDKIRGAVAALAVELGIASLLDRRPAGLSGGERQRVALGRALALRPDTLLLDEPLSALDEDTRDDMCTLLKSVQELNRVTVLHVTHNRNEAARLADCVFRLEDGAVKPEAADRAEPAVERRVRIRRHPPNPEPDESPNA